MDYMNIDYEEEENSGILGILTLGRSVPQLKVTNLPLPNTKKDNIKGIIKGNTNTLYLHQVPQADLTITNSADILRYLYGCHAGRGNKSRKLLWRRQTGMEITRSGKTQEMKKKNTGNEKKNHRKWKKNRKW